MTPEQFLALSSAANVAFEVDYSTIKSNKINIINIVFISDFEYKYDRQGNPLNWPVLVAGTCWNQKLMYIYN